MYCSTTGQVAWTSEAMKLGHDIRIVRAWAGVRKEGDAMALMESKPTPEDELRDIMARLDRVAPLILWPDVAYSSTFVPHGSFITVFEDTNGRRITARAPRRGVAVQASLPTVEATSPSPAPHGGSRGLNLKFGRRKGPGSEAETCTQTDQSSQPLIPAAGHQDGTDHMQLASTAMDDLRSGVDASPSAIPAAAAPRATETQEQGGAVPESLCRGLLHQVPPAAAGSNDAAGAGDTLGLALHVIPSVGGVPSSSRSFDGTMLMSASVTVASGLAAASTAAAAGTPKIEPGKALDSRAQQGQDAAVTASAAAACPACHAGDPAVISPVSPATSAHAGGASPGGRHLPHLLHMTACTEPAGWHAGQTTAGLGSGKPLGPGLPSSRAEQCAGPDAVQEGDEGLLRADEQRRMGSGIASFSGRDTDMPIAKARCADVSSSRRGTPPSYKGGVGVADSSYLGKCNSRPGSSTTSPEGNGGIGQGASVYRDHGGSLGGVPPATPPMAAAMDASASVGAAGRLPTAATSMCQAGGLLLHWPSAGSAAPAASSSLPPLPDGPPPLTPSPPSPTPPPPPPPPPPQHPEFVAPAPRTRPLDSSFAGSAEGLEASAVHPPSVVPRSNLASKPSVLESGELPSSLISEVLAQRADDTAGQAPPRLGSLNSGLPDVRAGWGRCGGSGSAASAGPSRWGSVVFQVPMRHGDVAWGDVSRWELQRLADAVATRALGRQIGDVLPEPPTLQDHRQHVELSSSRYDRGHSDTNAGGSKRLHGARGHEAVGASGGGEVAHWAAKQPRLDEPASAVPRSMRADTLERSNSDMDVDSDGGAPPPALPPQGQWGLAPGSSTPPSGLHKMDAADAAWMRTSRQQPAAAQGVPHPPAARRPGVPAVSTTAAASASRPAFRPWPSPQAQRSVPASRVPNPSGGGGGGSNNSTPAATPEQSAGAGNMAPTKRTPLKPSPRKPPPPEPEPERPNTQRCGGDDVIDLLMEEDDFSCMSVSMLQFTSMFSPPSPKSYSARIINTLMDDGRKFKHAAEARKQMEGYWSPFALGMYLQSCLLYMEAAYGHERQKDREVGPKTCCALLDNLAKGMLSNAQREIDSLLRQHRATAAVGTAPDVLSMQLALEALRLLTCKLGAICRLKWLTMHSEGMKAALGVLSPPVSAAEGNPAGGGTSTAGAAAAGAGGRDDLKRTSPAGDSASSTLDPAANAQTTKSLADSLQQVADCVGHFGKVAEMWQVAADDTSRLATSANSRPAERGAQIAAAQIQALGFEAGLWDLLGTVTIARKALDSLSSMPCMAA